MQRNALPVPLVDHRQHPKLPAVKKLVMHKIRGTLLLGACGDALLTEAERWRVCATAAAC